MKRYIKSNRTSDRFYSDPFGYARTSKEYAPARKYGDLIVSQFGGSDISYYEIPKAANKLGISDEVLERALKGMCIDGRAVKNSEEKSYYIFSEEEDYYDYSDDIVEKYFEQFE